jgi:hypothetical protein
MRNQAIFTALLLTFVASSGAFAQNIYKWTDDDGNVHYGDIPAGAQAETVAISSKPTDPQRVQAQTQARVSAQTKAAEEAANAPQGPSPQELKAEADERASKCTRYRQTLQKFVVSRRLYREDENGERVYLDETETQAARDRAEGHVEVYSRTLRRVCVRLTAHPYEQNFRYNADFHSEGDQTWPQHPKSPKIQPRLTCLTSVLPAPSW